MLGKIKIFIFITMFVSCTAFADEVSDVQQMPEQDPELQNIYEKLTDLNWGDSERPERKEIYDKLDALMNSLNQNMDDLQKNYEDLKANEQSTANKTLTALTTAATGIGGMELAMGLSEQKADKDAVNSMAAYIATMRCTYADGKQVKAGPDEIELPGGNNQQLMNLRNEYFALATDLKERKTALNMKPGIESEEILDKSQTGLYDDEMIGITSGAYESLYRAQMLGADADQAKIDENAKASKNRVMGGAIAAGAGAVVGIAGNAIINKNAPKNRADEIKQQRSEIKTEINEILNSEIERCNNLIEENQRYASTLKSNSVLMKDENIKSYVESVEKLQKLTSVDDISEIKEHPLCR